MTVAIEGGERVTITLRDRAPEVDVTAFDPGDLRDLAESASPRGRGLAMIELLTQSMRHRRRRGGGNELELTFSVEHLTRRAEATLDDAA